MTSRTVADVNTTADKEKRDSREADESKNVHSLPPFGLTEFDGSSQKIRCAEIMSLFQALGSGKAAGRFDGIRLSEVNLSQHRFPESLYASSDSQDPGRRGPDPSESLRRPLAQEA